ncbi:MAG: CBS domain-containing protein [bacterium]
MKIKEIMIPNVVAINQEISIKELVKVFIQYKFDMLPVVNKENLLVGKISLDEIVSIFFPRYYDIVKDYTYIEDFGLLEKIFVAQSSLLNEDKLLLACDVMNPKVIAIEEGSSVLQAVSLMQSYGVSRLPVISNQNKLIGIISHIDIILTLLKKSFCH